MSARRVMEGALLATVLLLAAPTAASGAVTVGSNLSDPQNAETCFTPCTAVQESLRAASTAPSGLTSPINGIVVRWRIKLGTVNSCISAATGRLRVLRGNLGVTGGPTESLLLPAGTHTFPVRLPVSVGDRIGIDGSVTCSGPPPGPGLPLVYYDPNPGIGVVDYWTPQLADGDPRDPGQLGGVNSFELLVNADIEADADHDGYGDETQDGCPTDASIQGACPSPVTPRPASDKTAPAGLATFASKLKLRSALRRGLRGKVSSNEAAEITGTAAITRRLARRLGLKSARAVVVARGRASLAGAGVAALRLEFTKKAKRKLRRVRKLALTLQVVLTDRAGNASTLTRKVTLKR